MLLAVDSLPYLLFVPSSLEIFLQLIYYRIGISRIQYSLSVDSLPSLSILVPIKGETIEVIQGLIDNLTNLKWDRNKLEVIIISDDDETTFEKIRRSITIPSELRVILVRRQERIGQKSGALLHGLRLSRGNLILTLDVDARLYPDSVLRAYSLMIDKNCDAVSMDWRGYSRNGSKLARGLMVATAIGSISVLRGRHRAGMVVFPVGSGTLFKREALQVVNGWDPSIVQEDLEIGVRLAYAGKTVCGSDIPIMVEVPDDLYSFYIQQTRWAMGSMETLIWRFKYIIFSKKSIFKKLEMIVYLLQYIPISITFISATLLVMLLPFVREDLITNPVFTLWITVTAAYAFLFVNMGRKLGMSFQEALLSLGRTSAYTVAISPYILMWTLRGLRKRRPFRVTPKGKRLETNSGILIPILTFGVIFMVASLAYMAMGMIVTGLWLFYYSAGYIYTVYIDKKQKI
jgi:cellulose synthase/poly-beta-1,6-N-acetylglucosamine synthase-like glycosyltransferase